MQSEDGKLFSETESWYQEAVKKLINLVSDANCIVEVNPRGIYQKKTNTPYPSLWILELIKSKALRITISSDAHHPDDIVNHFPETAQLLAKAGFKELAVLSDGHWQQRPFNEKGIIE